jgi:hypothetical protein
MHTLRDAEQMFQTLFSNTFCSSAMIKCSISGKYNDTALPSRYPSSSGNSILYLVPQNTLTKTSFQHFLITYEAVTNIFMLDTNRGNTLLLFSRSHTHINTRYTIICKFQHGVVIRVTHKNVVCCMLVQNCSRIHI